MNFNSKLDNTRDYLLSNEGLRRLVEKLDYLTVIQPDISFTISVVSQLMAAPSSIGM